MTDRDETRRKRLRYRSWHRGTREMDLLLGGFADRHLAAMSEEQLGQYEAILHIGDPELYAWIVERAAVPAAFDTPVMKLIRNFRITRSIS